MQASFSYRTKTELSEISVKSSCCRRALTFGMLFAATVNDGSISVSFSHVKVSDLFAELIKESFGKESTVEKKVVVGRETWTHTFSTKRVVSYLTALEDRGGIRFQELVGFRCGSCRQAFLRGVFLAIGTVTDPAKAFHTELLLSSSARAEKLDEFLALCGIPARRIERRGRIGLYYKNSTAIEEFFAEMGANSLVFDLMNIKIEKDIRNQENRATNCVARNISRSVDAIRKQVAAIEMLRDHGILDGLPEDLRTTAKLWLKFEEASLAELASQHTPPISKSGLNHRIERLMELSEKIK